MASVVGRFFAWGAAVALLASCSRSLDLPAPPGPVAPGVVYGRVVYAKPGQATAQPASGAVVQVLNTNLSVVAGAEGQFLLDGITEREGSLLVRFDGDQDGVFERQKVLDFAQIGAAPGRELSLGDVVIGRNARLQGQVLRADLGNARGGHAGTSVFVPEAPFTAYTNDDGSFSLEALPEGTLQLAVFRPGYDTLYLDPVSLRSGESVSLSQVSLTVSTSPVEEGVLKGTVVVQGAASAEGTAVVAWDGVQTFSATADSGGSYRITPIPTGRYDVRFERQGYAPTTVFNIMVSAQGETAVPNVTMMPGAAGTPDAGAPNALGDGGAFSLADAGPNQPPVAVVAQGTVGALLGDPAQLDGRPSWDPEGKPLVYHWVQDGGTPVALSLNHSRFAAVTALDPPSPAGQELRFFLTVEDEGGLTSPPTPVTVMVADSPTAAVTPALSWALSGQVVTLSAAASYDPLSLPLSFEWRKLSGAGTLSATTGTTVQVTGATQASTAVLVELVAVNTAGLRSAPVVATVNFQQGGLDFAVQVPPNTVVDGGDTTYLTATVTPQEVASAQGLAYEWTYQGTSGAGTPVLAGVTTPTLEVTTPVVANGTQTFHFQVTVSVDAGSAGFWARDAFANITVRDTTPPQVQFSQPVAGGSGSRLRAELEFDEQVNPNTVNDTTVYVVDASDAGVPATLKTTDERRVAVLYDAPLTVGAPYTLKVGAVQDPSGNAHAPQSIAFVAAEPDWTPAFKTVGTSTTEPRPGLAALFTPAQGTLPSTENLYLFARRGGGACTVDDCPWLLTHAVNDFGQMNLQEEPNQTTPLSSLASPGPRAATFGSVAYGRLGDSSFFARAGTSWLQQQPPPGPVFTDGVTGYSVERAGTALRFSWFDPQTQTWTKAAAAQTIVSTDSWSVSGAAAGAVSAGGKVVVAATNASGDLWTFVRAAGGSTWAPLQATALAAAVSDVRVVFLKENPLVLARVDGGQPTLSAWYFTPTAVSFPALATGSSISFDALSRGKTAFVALSVSGSIEVRTFNSGTQAWGALAGPFGQSPKFDPACFASQPEMEAYGNRIWLAWQELACPGTQWSVVARGLE